VIFSTFSLRATRVTPGFFDPNGFDLPPGPGRIRLRIFRCFPDRAGPGFRSWLRVWLWLWVWGRGGGGGQGASTVLGLGFFWLGVWGLMRFLGSVL